MLHDDTRSGWKHSCTYGSFGLIEELIAEAMCFRGEGAIVLSRSNVVCNMITIVRIHEKMVDVCTKKVDKNCRFYGFSFTRTIKTLIALSIMIA